jgi:hypothetical protein
MAVRNPPTEADFRARVAAIAHAMSDVPGHWLAQPWQQQEAMRAWQFWPAVADVHDLFEDRLRELRDDRARRSMPAIAAPPPPIPLTLAEREAMAAQAKELSAELRRSAAAPSGTAEPVRTIPLPPHKLLATYERLADEGNTAAAARAAFLRRQIEAGA